MEDELDPAIADTPQRLRKQKMEDLGKQEDNAPIQAWIMLNFGSDSKLDAIREKAREFGLAHRLDLGTSGPVLVGKTAQGYDAAKTQIHERDVVKDYMALVHGVFKEPRGTCRAGIDRRKYAETRKVTVHDGGDPAATIWEVMAEYESPTNKGDKYTLVHLRIITGRTHQIRAHMAHMGHPIISDWRYCETEAVLRRDEALCPRIFLHKFRISYLDMKGMAVSVSCSIQMDKELWHCLSQLRLVGGPALNGCAAPGQRAAKVVAPK